MKAEGGGEKETGRERLREREEKMKVREIK
jgi:hypothetical protein